MRRIGSIPIGYMFVPALYLGAFFVLLVVVWSKLDDASIIAIVSVLAGGLAGLVGSWFGALVSVLRVEQESKDRLKEFASKQALELTKLEFEKRRETHQQKRLLAPAKVYREFYRALFELYDTKTWPTKIEELGLLNILDYDSENE